eukprot:scaffold49521_cov33-Tisochrysis_lutea.AAC.3
MNGLSSARKCTSKALAAPGGSGIIVAHASGPSTLAGVVGVRTPTFAMGQRPPLTPRGLHAWVPSSIAITRLDGRMSPKATAPAPAPIDDLPLTWLTPPSDTRCDSRRRPAWDASHPG